MLALTNDDGNLRVVVAVLAAVVQVGTADNDTAVIHNHELAVDVQELTLAWIYMPKLTSVTMQLRSSSSVPAHGASALDWPLSMAFWQMLSGLVGQHHSWDS